MSRTKPNLDELKGVRIRMLATELGLVFPYDISDERVVKMIEETAKTSPAPKSTIALGIADELGIKFRGGVVDCFGFHETGNIYCTKCKTQAACAEASHSDLSKTTDGSRKLLLQPPSGAAERSKKPVTPKSSSQDAVRDEIIAYIASFSFLTQKVLKESVTFYFMDSPVLKVEGFTSVGYHTAFCSKKGDAYYETLGLKKTSYGWYYSKADKGELKALISAYLSVVGVSDEAVDNNHEHCRREILQMATDAGLQVLPRSGYDIIVKGNERLAYVEGFSHRGYSICFTRISDATAKHYNMSKNAYGYTYRRSDSSELKEIFTEYLSTI